MLQMKHHFLEDTHPLGKLLDCCLPSVVYEYSPTAWEVDRLDLKTVSPF